MDVAQAKVSSRKLQLLLGTHVTISSLAMATGLWSYMLLRNDNGHQEFKTWYYSVGIILGVLAQLAQLWFRSKRVTPSNRHLAIAISLNLACLSLAAFGVLYVTGLTQLMAGWIVFLTPLGPKAAQCVIWLLSQMPFVLLSIGVTRIVNRLFPERSVERKGDWKM